MTAVPGPRPLWHRLGRSLLPDLGARAGAAADLIDPRRTRDVRAHDALVRSRPDPPCEDRPGRTAP